MVEKLWCLFQVQKLPGLNLIYYKAEHFYKNNIDCHNVQYKMKQYKMYNI